MRCRGSLYINTGHLLSGAAGPALPVPIPGFAKRPSAERPLAFGGAGGGRPDYYPQASPAFFRDTKSLIFFFFPPPGDLMGEPRPISKALQKAASALGLCLWTHLTRNLGPLPCNPFEDSRTQDGLAILTQM